MKAQIDQDQDVLTLRVPGDLLSTNAETYRTEVARRMETVEAPGRTGKRLSWISKPPRWWIRWA